MVVVFKDPEDEDETGANVTLLVYQVEEDVCTISLTSLA